MMTNMRFLGGAWAVLGEVLRKTVGTKTFPAVGTNELVNASGAAQMDRHLALEFAMFIICLGTRKRLFTRNAIVEAPLVNGGLLQLSGRIEIIHVRHAVASIDGQSRRNLGS